MKLVYGDMEQILRFDGGCVNELVVENKRMFFDMVNSAVTQAEGAGGRFLLSISDRPVDFGKYADVTVQFAPFQLNRKSLLTKLYAALEKSAQQAENYQKTAALLGDTERYVLRLAEDMPFEISCAKLTVGAILKAVAPEIEEKEKSTPERIFDYMELVRELDRDRLFLMINMRTYFSDEEMECFANSACLHDFKVLLLEGNAFPPLRSVQRYTVDADLCEF